MPAMKSIIGRIVHYENPRDGAQAAIITGIHDEGVVHLHIFGISGDFRELCVPYSAEPKPLHWSWPPREEETQTEDRALLAARALMKEFSVIIWDGGRGDNADYENVDESAIAKVIRPFLA
jgi:hypothetical protein